MPLEDAVGGANSESATKPANIYLVIFILTWGINATKLIIILYPAKYFKKYLPKKFYTEFPKVVECYYD
jgi:hypothetical protein